MKKLRCASIVTATALTLGLTVQAQADSSNMMNNKMLQELKTMIEQQQAQINKQAAELTELKQQLSGNTKALTAKADKSELADIEATKATDKMVTSRFSNAKLSLYGHVNKAVLFTDNGDSSDWFVVDNINSQTRLGLKAAVDTGMGWVTGGRIEYGIVSNASSDVNQLDNHDATSTNFKLRWAELSFKNANFGKISLGKGDSASNNTAEIDLSGTTVASYAGITDMAGSTLWYDNSTETLSDIKIENVFSDFDGLSRTDRLRYDTPSFGGFSLAASGSSGDAYDGALFFSRQYGETKVAAGFGVADPGDLKDGADVQYSGSASVLLPMGLNATLSVGYLDQEDGSRDDPTNWWGKLGYQTKFYDAAVTAFSVEYGQTSDLRDDGDEAKTWGIAVVHNVTDWGTELYMAYRGHQLDSNFGDYDDINTFWTGARVKF
ncbi:MAG: porin [Gammaproteobacteria bacterium]|nr:porin [Gammaproteobacteria bacterium]